MSQVRAALRQFRQFVTENPRVAYRWGMDRVLAELEGTRMPEDTQDRLALDASYEPPVRRAPQGWQWRLVCVVCGAPRPPKPTGPGCVACELRKGA